MHALDVPLEVSLPAKASSTKLKGCKIQVKLKLKEKSHGLSLGIEMVFLRCAF